MEMAKVETKEESNSCVNMPEQTIALEEPLFPVELEVPLLDRIFSPRVVLFIFTALNFITYYDRGAISGCLTVIREDESIAGSGRTLTDTQSGFIYSGFMIGFMVMSPIFAAFGGSVASKWMIITGMVAWGLSCLGTAFAKKYWFLLLCRVVVGVGEAAFVGFTVTIIDTISPPNSRTLWIGTFYSMIPVGTAVGMAAGGVISSMGKIGSMEGWRLVFITEVMAAVPIVLPIFFLPAKYNIREMSSETRYLPLHKATWLLVKNAKFILIVFGEAMYCFVLGAVSVWGIPMLVEGPLHLTALTGSLIMGSVTALAGVFGSLAGGIAVDKMGGSRGIVGAMKCQLFNVAMVVICIPLGIWALFSTHLWLFVLLLVASVFVLFAITAPVNAAILTVVPLDLRAYAVSYCVLLIHLLGDFPSPTFAGYLSDHFFAGGCPNYDYTTCMANVENHCYWINGTTEGSASHCVNEFQLRNALLVVFIILVLAIPCWVAVYFLLRREQQESCSSPTTSAISLINSSRERC